MYFFIFFFIIDWIKSWWKSLMKCFLFPFVWVDIIVNYDFTSWIRDKKSIPSTESRLLKNTATLLFAKCFDNVRIISFGIEQTQPPFVDIQEIFDLWNIKSPDVIINPFTTFVDCFFLHYNTKLLCLWKWNSLFLFFHLLQDLSLFSF